MQDEKKKPARTRRCALFISVTAEEKAAIQKFADDNSVNLSAWVRKLLFEQLRERG